MNLKHLWIIFLPAVLLCNSVLAQTDSLEKSAPDESLKQKAEKGWFFYEKTPIVEEKIPKPAPVVPVVEDKSNPDDKKPKPDKCKKVDTWSTECGFVDPGTDFSFQEKQRDALMQSMVMNKNDPKAVENFQYYMKWVMERATEVANIWQYNMTQNPELDPQVKSPVSTFGLRLMTEVEHGHESEIYSALRNENAQLIYFSRTDCTYCHSMTPHVLTIAKKAGLPIWDASLDEACLPEFKDKCGTAAVTTKPAQLLQVTTVPSLFLYIKPGTWIRLSTGVTDESSITTRLTSFFAAYRNALLKGVSNGQNGRPSVDFSDTETNGASQGVAPSGSSSKNPTESDINQMLGKSK